MKIVDSLRTLAARAIGATIAAPRAAYAAAERGWMTIHDGAIHAFQRDIKLPRDELLGNWAVFACMHRIAGDIGKCTFELVQKTDAGIWSTFFSSAFSGVIAKPNAWQTRQQFMEQWALSKLKHGNTYVLKERDQRGAVSALYVLDPTLCLPLVNDDTGEVFYQLGEDVLSGVIDGTVTVPASEIIHDRWNCLFHPLVGLSPLYAAWLPAAQGTMIQRNSATFFKNMSRPGGILTAPGQIKDETAQRLQRDWNRDYTGEGRGKVAVLGDGLKYEALATSAKDAELVDQLKLSAEMVCTTFNVPAFKIGVGTVPVGMKVGDLNQLYYSDCLQEIMFAIETLMDEGLNLVEKKDGKQLGTMFNLDDLIRMDATTFVDNLQKLVGAAVMAPDEARQKVNLPPTPGGDAPLAQQQNYSLAALAKRDAKEDPFGTTPAPAPAPAPEPEADDAKALTAALLRKFATYRPVE